MSGVALLAVAIYTKIERNLLRKKVELVQKLPAYREMMHIDGTCCGYRVCLAKSQRLSCSMLTLAVHLEIGVRRS